jgi:hypothetical protein
MNDIITLKCVKDGDNLYMRITSIGYCTNNVRSSHNMCLNHHYQVNAGNIKVVKEDGLVFYNISAPINDITSDYFSNLIPYDVTSNDVTITQNIVFNSFLYCAICCIAKRDTIIIPCGHFYMCESCSIGKDIICCDICNGKIEEVINCDLLN